MKIAGVRANNRKKVFEVRTRTRGLLLPYAVCRPVPQKGDWVADAWVDREIGSEGFSYRLQSGVEGTIHIDHVLEYNRDPDYMGDLLLYNLSVEAQRRVEQSKLSTREIIRRLGTSPAQFYRLLDQTNYRKSLKQLLALLSILDCEVEFVVRERRSA